MKVVRSAILAFLLILALVMYIYMDNREFNQITNGQRYPVEQIEKGFKSLNPSNTSVEGAGITMTKLYTHQDSEELYFGFWYGNHNDRMSHLGDDSVRKQGSVQFLVKVVDSNGTTYNGTTTGKVSGTFSTLQLVEVNDFEYEKEMEDLSFSFYPLLESGGEKVPREKPLFQVEVPLKE